MLSWTFQTGMHKLENTSDIFSVRTFPQLQMLILATLLIMQKGPQLSQLSLCGFRVTNLHTSSLTKLTPTVNDPPKSLVTVLLSHKLQFPTTFKMKTIPPKCFNSNQLFSVISHYILSSHAQADARPFFIPCRCTHF